MVDVYQVKVCSKEKKKNGNLGGFFLAQGQKTIRKNKLLASLPLHTSGVPFSGQASKTPEDHGPLSKAWSCSHSCILFLQRNPENIWLFIALKSPSALVLPLKVTPKTCLRSTNRKIY